jgi:pimeloyl-ACP methyl ester carboxylesterase|tara:strand:- start:74 stop:886 length:813 start_codon:yes stop_codon:yes gene_type:complete
MSNWSPRYIQTNGIQLHYYRTGGDLPTIILAHGITDNGLCWTRLANYLMGHYDVIMIDARGHGCSDTPLSGYSKFDHAQDLAGLIEELELDQPHMIGHSMGASNVTSLAANYPHLVGQIILEDPPWFTETDVTDQQRAERRNNWQQSMIETQAKSVQEIMESGRQQNPTWDAVEMEAWVTSKKQFRLEAFGFIDQPFDWQEDVKRITSPTLLLTSDTELGGIVSAEIAELVGAINNNFQVDYIGSAGHSIRREQFDKYVASIDSFLALPI